MVVAIKLFSVAAIEKAILIIKSRWFNHSQSFRSMVVLKFEMVLKVQGEGKKECGQTCILMAVLTEDLLCCVLMAVYDLIAEMGQL